MGREEAQRERSTTPSRMYRLSSSALPSDVAPDGLGAPIYRLGGSGGAPIYRLDPSAVARQPGIAIRPVTRLSASATEVSGSTVIITPLSSVVAVEAGGVTYRPATDIANPGEGEFVHDPYTGQIAIAGRPSGDTAIVTGLEEATDAGPITNRKYIPGPYPDILFKVPVAGELSWNLSLEQHPTGSMTIQADNRNIAAIRVAFRVGIKFSLYGIGFVIKTYTEEQEPPAQYPNGRYNVTLALAGWNERACDRPTFLLGSFAQAEGTGGRTPNDPECRVPNNNLPGATVPTIPTSTSVQTLGQQVGLHVIGPAMSIKISPDASRSETTTVGEQLTQFLRPSGCFVDYFEPGRIIARSVGAVRVWTFSDQDVLDKITLQYQGKPPAEWIGTFEGLLPPSPDPVGTAPAPQALAVAPENPALIGYTAEYPKVKLTGGFTNPPTQATREDTRGQNQDPSTWPYRKPKRVTKKRGDLYPTKPPENTTALKTIDLNADASGPTKTEEIEISEDDVPVKKIVRQYGWAFLSWEVAASDGFGRYTLIGSPLTWWTKIREEITEYVYHPVHRYLVETRVSGFEYRRYKAETDALETITLRDQIQTASAEDLPALYRELALYTFEKVPLSGITQYILFPFAPYYLDESKIKAPTIQYKVCLPDGSSEMREKDDPNYSPRRWCALQQTYFSSFSSVPSPEDPIIREDATIVIPPPITKGRESLQRREVQITPSAKNATKNVFYAYSEFVRRFIRPSEAGDDDTLDRYVEFTSDMSSEGPGFSGLAETTQFSDGIGKPPEHSPKKPPQFERQEPELTAGDQAKKSDPIQYDRYLMTPGYSMNSAESGSLSFDKAATESEAIVAAQTELAIQDAVGASRTISFSTPFNAVIRPFDIVNATLNHIFYPSRVQSVSCTMSFRVVDGVPYAEGETQLQLGPNRTIPVTMTKVPTTRSQPTSAVSDSFKETFPEPVDFGSLLPINLKTRRNF